MCYIYTNRIIKEKTGVFRDEARHGKAFEGLLVRYFGAELLADGVKDKAKEIAKKIGL